ncbi:MAG: SDR family NAD(P)-dependent oxidoreductase, partial [Sulfurifustis sp.]
GGKVINIGSFLSNVALSFNPAYCTSKGAIVQLTRSTACAWAPDNIQVNAVLPGWVDTDMTRAARGVPGLTDYVLVRTPMKRVGQPDDLAGVAVFLASAASNFVTGAAIPVDGGLSAQA